jgi:hypothetical protein
MSLLRTYQLFYIADEKELATWKHIELATKKKNCVMLHDVMSKDGFVFM